MWRELFRVVSSFSRVVIHLAPFLVLLAHCLVLQSSSEECLKCMLQIPHDKCEAVSTSVPDSTSNATILHTYSNASIYKDMFLCITWLS